MASCSSTLDPEQKVVCPYNKTHTMPAKRLQYHLMKCRRNFRGIEFATCPFNARHVMPKWDIRHHIADCPDKAMLEPILSYEQSKNHEEGKHFKGCTDLPKYNDQRSLSRSAENWDEEIPDNPRIGVDPTYFARMEYKDLSGMSRSEKKAVRGQYYLPPGQRTYPLQEEQEDWREENIRRPHIQMSKFVVAQPPQQQSQVLSYSLAMAGIGRGGAAMSQQNYTTAGRANKIAAVGRGRVESVPGGAIGRGISLNNFAQTIDGTTLSQDSPLPKGYNNAVIADAKKKEVKKKELARKK